MGRHTKYPYHQWTDGQWHDVNPFEYGKTIASLRATLHQYANAHGYRLFTVNIQGNLAIRFERTGRQ